MGKLKDRLGRVGRSIWSGIQRFPVAVAAAAAIMVVALVLVHNTSLAKSTSDWLLRISFVLGLGIPLSIALQLLFERAHRPAWLRALLWAGLAGLLALYLFFLLPLPVFLGTAVTMRYLALLLASVALVVAVPYLPGRTGDERFALKLLWRLFVTGVFTGILIGGIALVLLMLDKLLGVAIGNRAYQDNAVLCLGLFAPSFFLAGVPGSQTDVQAEPYQPLMRVLIGYIIFPLLSIYTAIIYIYFVTVLVHWSWPSNMLVNLVLWYTAIDVLALYFMRSQSVENRWFRLFDRWYPRLTVLPIALLFTGLFIRIGAYGFTESRYFVLMLALWVAALTALAVARRPERRRNIVAPTLLAALALLSVLGPWNAFCVSRLSQNLRLEALLARNGMLTAQHELQPKADVPAADKRQIYDILAYFSQSHALNDVSTLAGKAPDMSAVPALLGFQRPEGTTPAEPAYHSINASEPVGAVGVGGYDYLFVNNFGKSQPSQQATKDGITMAFGAGDVFTVTRGGQEIYRKALDEYVDELDESYAEGKTYTQDELTRDDGNSVVRVRFVFNTLSVSRTGDKASYFIGPFFALVDVK